VKLDELRKAAEKVKWALPLEKRHDFSALWIKDGGLVAQLPGQPQLAAYLALSANALPGLLAVVRAAQARVQCKMDTQACMCHGKLYQALRRLEGEADGTGADDER